MDGDGTAPRGCLECKKTLPLDAFERVATGVRRVCKPCRSLMRKQSVAKAPKVDPASVPKPDACVQCHKGPADVDFQWRSEVKTGGWRATCMSCTNSKGYSQAHRAREVTKDADAYRKRNAETHLRWAHNNPDNVRAQGVKNDTEPDRKIKAIVYGASRSGVAVAESDIERLMAKLSDPCFFCTYLPEIGQPLNSLCRTEGSGSLSDATTVPACRACSALKNVMSADLFISHVRRIDKHLGLERPMIGVKRALPFSFGGTEARRAAPAKEKRDDLSPEQRLEIWSSPCYMCGRAPSFGVDRLDSDGHYTAENVRPCCMDCNYLKKDFKLEDVKAQLSHVFAHTEDNSIGDMDTAPLPAYGGKTRQPVSASVDVDGIMTEIIFPCMPKAAEALRVTKQAIEKSIRLHQLCGGLMWRLSTAAEYRRHALDPATAQRVFMAMSPRQ